MPELPEVETTCRGIAPHIVKRRVVAMIIRESRLRWPIAAEVEERLIGARFLGVRRRAKYILMDTDQGTLMVHLGMSGSLRIMSAEAPALFHDHVDIVLDDHHCLRYHDPRRFGSMHWLQEMSHPLLDSLGPEPLAESFSGAYLYECSRRRSASVKQFIMDGKVVVGVGNIYANEALFLSGIHPKRASGRVSAARYEALVAAIKEVLAKAIAQGGTTLRDFVGGDGQPGYFAQQLRVYGRQGKPCRVCQTTLKEIRQGGRSTVYCPACQR